MASGKSMGKNKRSGQIFFWTMVILPLVQFCIFYVGVYSPITAYVTNFILLSIMPYPMYNNNL